MPGKNYILSREVAEKKLRRIAYEIVERNTEENYLLLVGIKENGLFIANILKKLLEPIFNGQVEVNLIALNKKHPEEIIFDYSVDLNDKVIILIDDVANSGKTLLYALKPFLQFHPRKIQTVVLVERTHKAFPITSDYVGLSVATTLQENIIVEVEGEEISGAYMV